MWKFRTVKCLGTNCVKHLEGKRNVSSQVKTCIILYLDSWLLPHADSFLENVHAYWEHGWKVIFPGAVRFLHVWLYNSASEHEGSILPLQTVFIVTAFCSPCPFADRLFGHNFPQREFIVCKMKFYSRAQKSRCKDFRRHWSVDTK